MLRGLAATAEEACDDVVLALTGARREYAQMLTDWAERTSVAGAVNCGSRGKGLVARVRRVLDEHVRPVTRLSGAARVAVIACALVAVVLAGSVHVRAQAAPEEPADRMDRTVTQAVISGTVVGPDGEPVAGAHVATVVPPYTAAGHSIATSMTADDGTFSLRFGTDFPDAQQSVCAAAEGFGITRTLARPGDQVGIALAEEGAPIGGVVLNAEGQPVPGADVTARVVATEAMDITPPQESPVIPRTKTDEDGRFDLRGLPPHAKAALRVDAEGYAWFHDGWREHWPATGDEVTITLAREAIISGRLTRDGEPIAGVRIYAQPQDRQTGNSGSGTTDEDGLYGIDSLSAGVYNVMVDAPPEWTAAAQEGVEVAVGEHRRDCHLRAIDGVLVRGKLTWEDTGEPVVEAGVGAYGPAHPRSSAWVQTAWTDRSGRYEMRLPPGENMLYVYGMPEGGEEATPKRRFVKVTANGEHVADFRIARGE
jgi:hypothetical protein